MTRRAERSHDLMGEHFEAEPRDSIMIHEPQTKHDVVPLVRKLEAVGVDTAKVYYKVKQGDGYEGITYSQYLMLRVDGMPIKPEALN